MRSRKHSSGRVSADMGCAGYRYSLSRAVVLERLVVEAGDPDDSFLLAMTLTGNADNLVTGD